MQRELISLLVGLGTIAAAAQPAEARTRCGPRDAVLKMLHERFDETRRGIGLSGPTQVLEVFASSDGTWTVIVTDPQGRSCLVASGQGWEDLREGLPMEDEAA